MTMTDLASGASPVERVRDVARIRDVLNRQREAQLAHLDALTREHAAAGTSGQAQLRGLTAGLRQTVAQIDTALMQLEAGRYGICLSCSEPIAPPRLEALPAAVLCLRCQRLKERR
jgi:DnaK suppressor protein